MRLASAILTGLLVTLNMATSTQAVDREGCLFVSNSGPDDLIIELPNDYSGSWTILPGGGYTYLQHEGWMVKVDASSIVRAHTTRVKWPDERLGEMTSGVVYGRTSHCDEHGGYRWWIRY